MKFRNIILDLGGVVLDIDYNRTIEAFRSLGIHNADTFYSKATQVTLFDDLEKGNITEQDFYSGIRKMSDLEPTDKQIRDAWNALIICLPEENVNFLSELKKDH